MDELVKWVESHPTTIDLAKWTAVLLVAWISGALRLIWRYAKRPSISLIPEVSRCYVEYFDEYRGHKNATLAAFLVDVSVRNPTNGAIVIESFSLNYQRRRLFFSRSNELHSITLPNRPRQTMGSGTKISKVFFSRFDDGHDDLTMSGEIKEKGFQEAYLLFVSFTHGAWNPKTTKGHVKTRISCQLTTGEILTDRAQIQVIRNPDTFDAWVPGIIDQVKHESAWNAAKKSKR